MRRFGLGLVILLLLTTALIACVDDSGLNPTADARDKAAADVGAEPTFVRVTVTPAPIDTPTPTLAPTVVSPFTAEQLADPVFPDWLDPELNDEQPEDEVVFAGWHDYLNNTLVEYVNRSGQTDSVHLCDQGTVVEPDGEINEMFLWDVTRTASMSSSRWGQVALTLEILADVAEAGRAITVLVIFREDGKLMQIGWTAPTEMTVTRSKLCLEMFS
jgi:hypothetical protein